MALGATENQEQDKGLPSKGKAGEQGMTRLRPGMADRLAGEGKDFRGELQPYLPMELIGGSIPHIPGEEDEAVWNAAAQACATEKVHYVYSEIGRAHV